jgi:hypothetical protein
LKRQNINLGLIKPGLHSLAKGSANAIDVDAGNPEHDCA